MIIDNSLKKEILSSSSFIIRLYSGVKPATFTFDKDDLEKVKVFLKHDGSKPKPKKEKKRKNTNNPYTPH